MIPDDDIRFATVACCGPWALVSMENHNGQKLCSILVKLNTLCNWKVVLYLLAVGVPASRTHRGERVCGDGSFVFRNEKEEGFRLRMRRGTGDELTCGGPGTAPRGSARHFPFRSRVQDDGEGRDMVWHSLFDGAQNYGTEGRRSRSVNSDSTGFIEELHLRLCGELHPMDSRRWGVERFSLMCEEALMRGLLDKRMDRSGTSLRSHTSTPNSAERFDVGGISEPRSLEHSLRCREVGVRRTFSRTLMDRVKDVFFATLEAFRVHTTNEERVGPSLHLRRPMQGLYLDFPQVPLVPHLRETLDLFSPVTRHGRTQVRRGVYAGAYEPNWDGSLSAEPFAPNFIDFLFMLAIDDDDDDDDEKDYTQWARSQSILDNMGQYAAEWTFNAREHGVRRNNTNKERPRVQIRGDTWRRGEHDGGRETSGSVEKSDGADLNSGACCICFSDYQHGEKLVTLRCLHIFHSACVRTWIEVSQKHSCPVCRQEIADTSK